MSVAADRKGAEMPSRDPGIWMWAEACEMLDQAERLHRTLYRPARVASRERVWEPPVDIFETDRELWIVVALPGVAPEATTVTVEEGILVVTGVRSLPEAARGAVLHRLEIPRGRFERRIELPPGTYGVSGRHLADGCLAIRLEKIG